MTPKERVHAAIRKTSVRVGVPEWASEPDDSHDPVLLEEMAAAIEQAVAEEREACADVAERVGMGAVGAPTPFQVGLLAATAIRARGTPAPSPSGPKAA